ncbi:hypothetical protein [Pedobacter sp. SG918]|uniref:hypothetical protein n=1 Tax=Pedobacter sp. SG918 TaxID=2587136 RepID=UPI00146A7D91|nr:hypothetical protein [Pedobacter sp. SG918]NMN38502.1 hypothetical protein [Pedobacter sp. SG918]
MNKLISSIILHFLLVCSVTAQQPQKPAAICNGILLTRLTEVKSEGEEEKDTSKILYVQNSLKDSLFVYKIADGILSEATAYSLSGDSKGLYLHAKSILNGERSIEPLKITFSDSKHTLLVNQDEYRLFPEFYAKVKQQVGMKHSILGLFNLLEDYLEDYSIRDIYMPLLSNNNEQWGKSILESKIITKRSQSDLKDIWSYKYQYNRSGKLELVKGTSADEIHFSKKMSYLNPRLIEMSIYRNTEDRQIISRKASYNPLKLNLLKLTDHVEITGKDTAVIITTTISRKIIGKLKSLRMSQAEIIRLVTLNK